MDLKDLETRGFKVIPNFLNNTEIDSLTKDWDYRLFAPNKNYPIKHSSTSDQLPTIFEKVRNTLDQVNNQTILHVDRHTPRGIYTNTELKKYDFHQDHESYYIFQDHFNYLIFFIPFIKPVKNESGLSVVPLDTLKQKLPDLADSFTGIGAMDFQIKNGNTKVINNTTGEVYTLPFDIREITETPELEAGDLLLMRGDIIHGTQVNNSTRIAMSIRCFNTRSIITKERLDATCPYKTEVTKNNPIPYDLINSLFEKYNRNYITIGEYLEARNG